MKFLYTFFIFVVAFGVQLDHLGKDQISAFFANSTRVGDTLTLGNGQKINCNHQGAVVSLKFPCEFVHRRDNRWYSGGSHKGWLDTSKLAIRQDGFHFNNVFVEYPFDISPNKLPRASIEIRFYLNKVLNNRGWIIGHDNGGFDRAICTTDQRFGGIASPLGFSYPSKLGYPTVGKWYHVVATYENGKKTWLYVNDGSSATAVVAQQVKPNNNNGNPKFSIGGLRNYGGHTVDAVVSTVRVFNKVLNEVEVNNLFDNPL